MTDVRNKRARLAAVLGAAVIALAVTAPVSHAQPGPQNAERTVRTTALDVAPKEIDLGEAQRLVDDVLDAPDPDRALRDLAPAELELYRNATEPVAVEEIVDAPTSLARAKKGCWTMRLQLNWKSRLGFTYYRTWQRLGWCGNGKKITSSKVQERGASASAPGWSYAGHGGSGKRSVGWEVRSYTQERMQFVNGWVQTISPCTQIRGGASGKYSTRTTCKT